MGERHIQYTIYTIHNTNKQIALYRFISVPQWDTYVNGAKIRVEIELEEV